MGFVLNKCLELLQIITGCALVVLLVKAEHFKFKNSRPITALGLYRQERATDPHDAAHVRTLGGGITFDWRKQQQCGGTQHGQQQQVLLHHVS